MSDDPLPAPAGSVNVWRGFRNATRTHDEFVQFLGGVFLPACSLLQRSIGLRAHVTTIVPDGKPSVVPDQTALMFWATPQAHDLARKTLAERIYMNLHGDAYDMVKSHTPEVPQAITAANGTLTADQPYYLLDQPADWMLGSLHHLIGVRKPELSTDGFLKAAYEWAATFHANPPAGVDGALLSCGTEYLVAWVHSPQENRDLGTTLEGLANRTVAPVLDVAPRSYAITADLWSDWAGIDLTKDPSINVRFERPATQGPFPLQPR